MSWRVRWPWRVAAAAPEPPHGQSRDEVLRKRTLVLIFLIVTNLVGGLGLGLLVDARLIWIAIALPALFAILLVALRWSSTR